MYRGFLLTEQAVLSIDTSEDDPKRQTDGIESSLSIRIAVVKLLGNRIDG